MNLIPYVAPFVAHGSHGSITFCATTGRVLKNEGCDCGDCPNGYADVLLVDVAELRTFYREHWSLDELEHSRESLDVLELCWWAEGYGYSASDSEYRMGLLARCRDGHDDW